MVSMSFSLSVDVVQVLCGMACVILFVFLLWYWIWRVNFLTVCGSCYSFLDSVLPFCFLIYYCLLFSLSEICESSFFISLFSFAIGPCVGVGLFEAAPVKVFGCVAFGEMNLLIPGKLLC